MSKDSSPPAPPLKKFLLFFRPLCQFGSRQSLLPEESHGSRVAIDIESMQLGILWDILHHHRRNDILRNIKFLLFDYSEQLLCLLQVLIARNHDQVRGSAFGRRNRADDLAPGACNDFAERFGLRLSVLRDEEGLAKKQLPARCPMDCLPERTFESLFVLLVLNKERFLV